MVMAAGGARLDPAFPKLDLVDFKDRITGQMQAQVSKLPGRVRTRRLDPKNLYEAYAAGNARIGQASRRKRQARKHRGGGSRNYRGSGTGTGIAPGDSGAYEGLRASMGHSSVGQGTDRSLHAELSPADRLHHASLADSEGAHLL